ncbi:MAG: response regulator [Planctomycetaceae bacterium]
MSSPTADQLRVLFVDDEAPIRMVMKTELPQMGHDVTICESGESALKAFEENVFDAAIIDLKMPGLSGWDVIDHLRKVAPQTEIIISTGHGDLDDAIPRPAARGTRFFAQTLQFGHHRHSTAASG